MRKPIAMLLAIPIALIPAFGLKKRQIVPPGNWAMAQRLDPMRPKPIPGNGGSPLGFEANHGQLDTQVRFSARRSKYSLFLTSTEMVLTLAGKPSAAESPKPGRDELFEKTRGPQLERTADQPSVVRARPEGANPSPEVFGLEELPGKVSYLVGNDPQKWHTGISTYAKVKYKDIYPGIDWVVYGQDGHLEYDFIVAPGASTSPIRLAFEGAVLNLSAEGDLLLRTDAGEIRQHKPVIYQEVAGARVKIGGEYTVTQWGQVGFRVDAYDHSLPLVLDPELAFSTYLGGTRDDEGRSITVDAAGNAYVVCETRSQGLPTSRSALKPAFTAWWSNAFVAKFDPAGRMIYSTYFGGSVEDHPEGIAVAADGSVVIAGSTCSTDLPTVNAFQPKINSIVDGFLARLNPEGTALLYSTYLGGNGTDHIYSVALDSSGAAYVTGETYSSDFPLRNPMFGNLSGESDAFVAKIAPDGTDLIYSTYLGGSSPSSNWIVHERGYGIAVDGSGSAYVTGVTPFQDFPTVRALFPRFQKKGDSDSAGFIAKLTPDGSGLVYSTFLGASTYDGGQAISVDWQGNAFVVGSTGYKDFPLVNPAQRTLRGHVNGFVLCLSSAGDALLLSTYLGGSSFDYLNGISVDSRGYVWVVGDTYSSDFPTLGSSLRGYSDVMVAKYSSRGDLLLAGAFGGDKAHDHGLDVRADGNSNVWITGSTQSDNFPTVSPVQPLYGGTTSGNAGSPGDAIVLKLTDPTAVPIPCDLTGGGACSSTSAGGDADIVAGYGQITYKTPTAPGVLANFALRSAGSQSGNSVEANSGGGPAAQTPILQTEAGVPAVGLLTETRLFVDYDPNRDTGFAIINPSNDTKADIKVVFKDASGATVATSSLALQPRRHLARFVHDLAPDLPNPFLGSVTLTSSTPFGIANLNSTTNERREAIYSALPAQDLRGSRTGSTMVFPQIVDGSGASTDIRLMNASRDSTGSGIISFFDDAGIPLAVDLGKELGTPSSFRYTIARDGIVKFSTAGIGALRSGYVVLTVDSGILPIASVSMKFKQGDVLVSEAAVTTSAPTTSQRGFVELASSPLRRNTGVALVNNNGTPANLSLRLVGLDGSSQTADLTLPGKGHLAKFVSELFAGRLPGDFSGALTISSDVPISALTLRLSINERGDGIYSTLPLADLNNPPKGPLFIPHFVEGGGYHTQLIMVDTSNAGGLVQTMLYDESGFPIRNLLFK